VRWSKSEAQIKEELNDYNTETLAGKSKLTFRTVADLKNSLQAARQSTVQVCLLIFMTMFCHQFIQFQRTTITVKLDAQTPRFRNGYTVDLDYRDPWKVIVDWVRDETLAPHSTWYSVRKYLCRDGKVVEDIFDEPSTGENWREVDVSLSATRSSQSKTDAGHITIAGDDKVSVLLSPPSHLARQGPGLDKGENAPDPHARPVD
jgi:hypothetical protein